MKEEVAVCECKVIHDDVVEDVKKKMPQDGTAMLMAEAFKVFADKTRINILNALLASKMCVCDISCLLNMSHSSISHQLQVLRLHRLVKYEKVGKVVYYSIIDEHVEQILKCCNEHLNEKD